MSSSSNRLHEEGRHSSKSYRDVRWWTIEGLKDDVYLQLCKAREAVIDSNGREITVSKYYIRAWELLAAISAGQPPPYFSVNLADLPPWLIDALRNEPQSERNYIITQAVGRIFENVNPNLYHLSIARRLRWKLVP